MFFSIVLFILSEPRLPPKIEITNLLSSIFNLLFRLKELFDLLIDSLIGFPVINNFTSDFHTISPT